MTRYDIKYDWDKDDDHLEHNSRGEFVRFDDAMFEIETEKEKVSALKKSLQDLIFYCELAPDVIESTVQGKEFAKDLQVAKDLL